MPEQTPDEFINNYLKWLDNELRSNITEKDWEFKLLQKAEKIRITKTQHIREAV